MIRNIHHNPGPNFFCSVIWKSRSVQCCTCSKWVHLSLLLSCFGFKILGSSYSWSCPDCIPVFFWRSHNYQHCVFLFGLLHLVYFHCTTGPSGRFGQCHAPTPPSPLNLLPPTSCLLPTPSCSCLFSNTSSSPLTRSGFFNRMPEIFELGALN